MAAEAGQIQMAPSPAKILISACLVGQRVRYDGGHQVLQHPSIQAWQAQGRLIPCCPEVLGGLPIPRPPAEIIGGDGDDVLGDEAMVATAAGVDVTPAFLKGAQAALTLARSHAIRVAVLCQRSPSCGSRQVYNGRFQGVLVPGVGVTTALLRANGIAVFGPEEIDTAAFGLDVQEQERRRPERRDPMSHQPHGAGKSSFDLIDADLLFRKLALNPDDVLLDLGCGRGNYSFAAAGQIHKAGAIHAVDLWADGVAAVAARAREEGCQQIQTHHVDASDALPLGDDSVDLCLLATVLHDLVVAGKDSGALAEIVRVLKPGGRLAIVEFEKIDGPPGPPRHIRLAPADVEALLAPRGFGAKDLTPLSPQLYLAQFQWGTAKIQRSAS